MTNIFLEEVAASARPVDIREKAIEPSFIPKRIDALAEKSGNEALDPKELPNKYRYRWKN